MGPGDVLLRSSSDSALQSGGQERRHRGVHPQGEGHGQEGSGQVQRELRSQPLQCRLAAGKGWRVGWRDRIDMVKEREGVSRKSYYIVL